MSKIAKIKSALEIATGDAGLALYHTAKKVRDAKRCRTFSKRRARANAALALTTVRADVLACGTLVLRHGADEIVRV